MRTLIRVAGPEDAEEVVRVYVESWNRGFGPRMPRIDADAARVERWRFDLAAPTHRWWVAERQGVVVGVVGIGPSRDPVDAGLGELDTIAVGPSAWRTGVGCALMQVALRGLAEGPYREAILWTLVDYPQGEAFYAATGWIPNGRTRDGGSQASYTHPLVAAP
jgi:N-acetylglutamate synthase-like GNAT family acetyltransferase